MPLQVKLRVFRAAEETVELPVLTVKQWVIKLTGLPVNEIVVLTVQGCKIPKDEELLSSNPKLLNLKVTPRGHGG